MPVEGTANNDFFARLPWLQPLVDAQLGLPSTPFDYTSMKVEAGSKVYFDQDRQRISAAAPNGGRIIAWQGMAMMRVDPDSSYWVEWKDPVATDYPTFNVFRNGRTDPFQFYLDRIQGKEHLFEEYVHLISDPLLNPAGMPLQDGPYFSFNHDLNFELFFGRDGSPPRMVVPEDAVGVQPNVPKRFTIAVRPGTVVFDSQAKHSVTLEAEGYMAEVVGWNLQTGEVHAIRFFPETYIHETELAKHINAGSMRIKKIIEERMLYY